jgi:hypothetical protein
VPESPAGSESVPETVQLARRPPVVVIAPVDETATPQCGLLAMPKVTVPFCPVVTSWSVNAHEPVVVVVPTVGALWVIVTAVTVRVKVQFPVSTPEVSESVPDTVQLPTCGLPVVLIAPEDVTATPQAVDGV